MTESPFTIDQTATELASALGLPVDTVRQGLLTGAIRVLSIGGVLRVLNAPVLETLPQPTNQVYTMTIEAVQPAEPPAQLESPAAPAPQRQSTADLTLLERARRRKPNVSDHYPITDVKPTVPCILGMKEASRYINRNETSMYTLVTEGKLPGATRYLDELGRLTWYIPVEDLDIYNLCYNEKPRRQRTPAAEATPAPSAPVPPAATAAPVSAPAPVVPPARIKSFQELGRRWQVVERHGEEYILGERDACAFLEVQTPQRLRDAIAAKKLPYTIEKGAPRFRKADLEALKQQFFPEEEEEEEEEEGLQVAHR